MMVLMYAHIFFPILGENTVIAGYVKVSRGVAEKEDWHQTPDTKINQ